MQKIINSGRLITFINEFFMNIEDQESHTFEYELTIPLFSHFILSK